MLWIAASATASVGVLLLYVGPNLLPVGKGFAPSPLLGQAPLALMAIGMIGIVVGAAGVALSSWQPDATAAHEDSSVPGSLGFTRNRLVDGAALAGLIVALGALLAVILIELVWPIVTSTMRTGPCDQNPTIACFRAHPDYYQETGPGSDGFSTPVSRITNGILTPIMLLAWPLALAAALVSVIAVGSGTRRRRVAILGIVLGSFTVAGMGVQYLVFLLIGGD